MLILASAMPQLKIGMVPPSYSDQTFGYLYHQRVDTHHCVLRGSVITRAKEFLKVEPPAAQPRLQPTLLGWECGNANCYRPP